LRGLEGSLPCSQQPDTVEPSPHSSILASHFMNFKIILHVHLSFFQVVCFFGFSHLNHVCIFFLPQVLHTPRIASSIIFCQQFTPWITSLCRCAQAPVSVLSQYQIMAFYQYGLLVCWNWSCNNSELESSQGRPETCRRPRQTNYLLTYLLTYLLIYLLTYLLRFVIPVVFIIN